MLPLLAATALAGPGLELSAGYGHTELRDEHQSPLRYAGNTAEFAAAVYGTGDGTRIGGGLDLGAGSMGAGPEQAAGESSLQIDLQLQGQVTTRLARFGGLDLRGGLGVTKQFHYADEVGFHPWGFGLLSADAHLSVETDIGPARLTVRGEAPVAGLLTRHNWSLDPVSPGNPGLIALYAVSTRPVAFHRFTAGTLATRVSWERDNGAVWFVEARVNGTAYPDPEPLRRMHASARVGIRLPLGGA